MGPKEVAEAIRKAYNDGYAAGSATEREACRKEYEEICGIPMREVARILARKWFRPEDWRNPSAGMTREGT